jgi:hypothetical protein
MTAHKLLTDDEAIEAMTPRLVPLPQDSEARANAIHEAARWFAENVIAPREARIAELRQEHDDLEQRVAELEARLTRQTIPPKAAQNMRFGTS